jgi:hypothetical protein
VAQPDDPRVQFPGRRVAMSRTSPFALWQSQGSQRAVWTGGGLGADGALFADRAATLTLDRTRTRDVRSVELLLRGRDDALGPVAWRLVPPGGHRTRSGRLRPGAERALTLPVPTCKATCGPVVWRLTARGTYIAQPESNAGSPASAPPVMLQVLSARLDG